MFSSLIKKNKPSQTFTLQNKEAVDSDNSNHGDGDDEIPTMTRRPLPRGRARKRVIAVDDRETGVCFVFFLNVNYFIAYCSFLKRKHLSDCLLVV